MASTMRAWRAAAAVVQEAAVGHVVGDGVGERVEEIREEPRLVEELSGDEPADPLAQRRLG